MTISIWRYSHLALAISSFLLVALAAITGTILAFEPITVKSLPYKAKDFNEITIAQSIPAIKNTFDEVTEVTVDVNQFVMVDGVTIDGDAIKVYIDPRTGKTLGAPHKQSDFFQWVTTLHRSLFLHEIGRLFVGITAFLLLLIVSSGIILIIKRQRGVKRFFAKVVRENFAQYYHVTLGRLLLVPLLIITITGTYLSMVRFGLIAEHKITQKIDFDAIKSTPEKKVQDFDIFKKTPMAEVQSIEFPFSDDPEDYFTIKLKDREITVNQITGELLSEVYYPTRVLLNNLSLDLHTGRTNSIWAVVLALAALNILFFIYSGFAITLKRTSGKIKNKYRAEESNYIILVGSENGTTFRFAKAMYKELINAGKKCYLTQLNNYQVFAQAEQLIIFSATYGLGDAPTNASKFTALVEKHPQPHSVQFSVLGFGSTAYPDFCKYAFEINNLLTLQPWAQPLLEIHTVNDKSPQEFGEWLNLWSQKNELPLTVDPAILALKPKRLQTFIVSSKTEIAHEEGAFMIKMRPKKRTKFTSGDLLAIYPAQDHRERLYSIGKLNGEVQLSVKLHAQGLGSNYLYDLKPGDQFKAKIDINPNFHPPKRSTSIIMIANGTGIAPFLGMIGSNDKKTPYHLYCGFRGAASFALYEEAMKNDLMNGKLTGLHVAYSREGEKQYVKDLLARDQQLIADVLKTNGTIMICGSLAMQKNVIELLEEICLSKHIESVSFYQSRQQILMDCY